MKIAQFSGGPPFITMVKTADLRNTDDASPFGRLHRPCFRRIFVPSQMSTTARC
jgi:hypothetical protein